MKTLVYIFGNPDLEIDNLPLKILPRLQSVFPDIEFLVKDPNEEWEIPEKFIVIDTVLGIPEPMRFNDLKEFATVPRFSVHDFDALTNLRLLDKLGRLGEVRIIGLPPETEKAAAVEYCTIHLKELA